MEVCSGNSKICRMCNINEQESRVIYSCCSCWCSVILKLFRLTTNHIEIYQLCVNYFWTKGQVKVDFKSLCCYRKCPCHTIKKSYPQTPLTDLPLGLQKLGWHNWNMSLKSTTLKCKNTIQNLWVRIHKWTICKFVHCHCTIRGIILYIVMWQCYSHSQLLEVLHVNFMVCALIDN